MSYNKTPTKDVDDVLRNSFQYVEQNHQEFSKEIIDLNESKYIPSGMNHMVLTTWICDSENANVNVNVNVDPRSNDSYNDGKTKNGGSDKEKPIERKKKNKNNKNKNAKKKYVIHKNDLQPNLYFPLPTGLKNTNISNSCHNLHIYKSINVKRKDDKLETFGGQNTGFIDNFSVNAINSKYNNHDVEFVEYTTINVPLKYGDYFVDYSWMPLTKQEMDIRMKARNGNSNSNSNSNGNGNGNGNSHDTRKEDICVLIVTNTHFLYFDLNNGNSTLLRQGRSVYAGIDFVRMVENNLLKGFQKAFFFNELIKNFNKNKENINDCVKYKPQCALWFRLFKKKPILTFLNKNFSINLPELAHDFDLKNNKNYSRNDQNNSSSSGSSNNNTGVDVTMNNVNDVNNIHSNMGDRNNSAGIKAGNVDNIGYSPLQNKLHYVAMEAMYGPMITSERDRKIIIKDYQLSGDGEGDEDDEVSALNIGGSPDNGNNTRHSRSINHGKFLDGYINKFYDQWAEKYGVEFEYYEDFTKNHNSAKKTILNEGNELVLDKILNLFFTVLDNGIVILDIDGYVQLPIFLNMEKKNPGEHISNFDSNESGLLCNSNDYDNFSSDIESNYKLKLYDNFTLLMYNEKDVFVCNIQHLFDNYLILDMIETDIRLNSLVSYWRIVLNEKIIDLSVKPFTKFWTSLKESYETANEKKKRKKNLNLIEDLILLFSTGEYSIDLKNWFINSFGSKNNKKWNKLFNEMYDITLQLTMLNSCVERMFIELNQLDAYAKGFCFVNQLKFIPSYLSCVDKLKETLKDDFLIKLNILSNTDLKLEYEKHLKFLKWIGMWCAHFEDEDKPIKITPPEDINMILDFMLEVLQNIDIVNEDVFLCDDGNSVARNSGLVLLNFQKSNHMNLIKVKNYSNCVKIDFASFLSLLLNNDVDFFESIDESFKIKDVSVINDSIHCIQHSELENSLQIYNLENEVCIVDLIKDFVEEEEEDEEVKAVLKSDTASRQTTKKGKIKKLKIKEVLFANDNFTNSSFNNFDVNITYF